MKTKKRSLIICCMLFAFLAAIFGVFLKNGTAHAEEQTYNLTMTLTPQGSVWGDYIFCTTTLTESYINTATWKISSTMGMVSEYFDITTTNTLLSYSHTSDGRTFFDMSDTTFTVTITEEQKNKIEHFSQWGLSFTIYCGNNIIYLGESTGTSYNRYWSLIPDDEMYYFSYTITLPSGTEPEEVFYTIDFTDTDLYFKEPESWRTALNFELEHVNDYIDEAVNVTLFNDGSSVAFFQGYMEYTITRINTSTEGNFNVNNYWYKLSVTNFSFLISEYNANLINGATIDRTYFLLLAGSLELCNAADESSNNYKLTYTITEHVTEPTVPGEEYTPPPATLDTTNYVKIDNIQDYKFYTDLLNDPDFYLEEPIRMYFKDDYDNICYLSTYASGEYYSYTRVELFKTRIIHVITLAQLAFPVDSATKSYLQIKTPQIYLNFGRPNEVAYLSGVLPDKANDSDKYDNCYFQPEYSFGLLSVYDMPTENEFTDNGHRTAGEELSDTLKKLFGLPDDWTLASFLKSPGKILTPIIIIGGVVLGVWIYSKIKKSKK